MKKKAIHTTIATLALALSLATFTGCAGNHNAAETAAPVLPADPVSPAEPAVSPEAETETGRRDGERFEEVIVIEGMEEAVRYEHVRNDKIGFEMDYDYDLFERRSEPERECFVSRYDDPENPLYYLEVTYSAENADTVSASVSEALSDDFEIIIKEPFTLDRAGNCARIDASGAKGGGGTSGSLRTAYIIPAADGSRVATAHYSVESAEGVGRRFACFMDTFSVIASRDGSSDKSLSLAGIWQTASMGYADDGTIRPEYYVRFTDSDIIYGRMEGGEFVPERSDKIARLEETAAGGVKARAESSNGVRYAYQTSESDNNVLEYYETWREEDFPEMYRGGASLSRSN